MLRRPNRGSQDFSDEIQAHIELEADDLMEGGMDREAALASARRTFGNMTQSRERFYESGRWMWFEQLSGDIRYAARSLIQSPGLSAAVVTTLALGIGVNASIFSLVDAVLVRSLEVRSPEELFVASIRAGTAQVPYFSYPMFKDLEESVADYAQLFAVSGGDRDATFLSERGDGVPERIRLEMVSGRFFSALGVRAMRGRVLTQQDDLQRGQHSVAVISHRFWRSRFASESTAVGRNFKLNATTFSVVGVAQPGFYGVTPGAAADIWVPTAMQEEIVPLRPSLNAYNRSWLQIMGRRISGVGESVVSTRMNFRFAQVQQRLAQDMTTAKSRERMLFQKIELEPGEAGFDALRRQYSRPLQILMIVAALILLVACANVANLLFARATTRVGDSAVRLALGAPRSRLIRQCLIESLLLASVGGVAAVALASLGSRALLALASHGSTPLVVDVGTNWRLTAFSASVAAVTAIIFGVAPAARGSRADARVALGAVGRGATDDRGRSSLGSALAVVQLAIAVVLVVCAGLFLRTITNLHAAESGFNRENVLMVRIGVGAAGYGLPRGNASDATRRTAEARLQGLLARVIGRLAALPGVTAVTKSKCGFLTNCYGNRRGLVADGGATEPSDEAFRFENVWPGYVQTMGLTLLAGRGLSEEDGAETPPVALINEVLARKYFGTSNPVGRTFRWEGGATTTEVVGVVKNVNHRGPRSEISPYVYYPHAQNPSDLVALTIRSAVPAESLAQPVRETIAETESKINVLEIATLEQQFDSVIRTELLLGRLTAAFGGLALALTCVGLSGLLAYSVARRTNEIGLRMALGAQRGAIIAGVLRKTLLLVGVGLAAGLTVAVAAARLLESQLYEVTPGDPATIATSAGIVIMIALLAAGMHV